MGKAPDKATAKQNKDVVNKTASNLDAWYKKNGSRIKLIDNLVLDCQLCKTKEAKDILRKEIDLNLKDVTGDVGGLNKQNKGLFKDVVKPAPVDLQKELKEAFEKLTTIINKDTVKLRLDFEDKNPTEESPVLMLEIKF